MRAAVLFVIVLLISGGLYGEGNVQAAGRARISVQGEAVVHVAPDRVIITMGIESRDVNINTAKEKNTQALKKTTGVLKEAGVKEKDIQTSHLSIEPRWDNYASREKFIGYFVRNSLSVTISDVGILEEVITRVLESGVNHIHSVDFQTSEFKMHRELAREAALLAAREKAEKMAAVLGQKIGDPIDINESPMYSWHHSGWGGFGRPSMAQSNIQLDRGPSGEMTETIALGKIGIRANVGVVFELIPR